MEELTRDFLDKDLETPDAKVVVTLEDALEMPVQDAMQMLVQEHAMEDPTTKMEAVVKEEIEELYVEITKAVLLSTKTFIQVNKSAHCTTQTLLPVAALNASKRLLKKTQLHAAKKLSNNVESRRFVMNSNPIGVPHVDQNSITTTSAVEAWDHMETL